MPSLLQRFTICERSGERSNTTRPKQGKRAKTGAIGGHDPKGAELLTAKENE
jgi:hypothetical protein